MRCYVTVTLNCGQCSKQKRVPLSTDKEIPFDALSFIQFVAAAKDENGETRQWVVENNGGTIDTYCSKKCAA